VRVGTPWAVPPPPRWGQAWDSSLGVGNPAIVTVATLGNPRRRQGFRERFVKAMYPPAFVIAPTQRPASGGLMSNDTPTARRSPGAHEALADVRKSDGHSQGLPRPSLITPILSVDAEDSPSRFACRTSAYCERVK
jgi:hypothetical protein